MDKEVTKARKQLFLKELIIGDGDSPSDFLSFSLQRKTDGDDIDNWTEEELRKTVDEFKSQPDVFFRRHNTWHMKDCFGQVEFSHVSKDEFLLKVKEAENPVIRTLDDIKWAFRVQQTEHRHMAFATLPELNLCQSRPEEVLSDSEIQSLKYYVEYLYLFFYLRDFQSLKVFFTANSDQFRSFKAGYKPNEGPVQSILSNLSLQSLMKRLNDRIRDSVDFSVQESPSGWFQVPLLSVHLEKAIKGWNRYLKSLGDIEVLLGQLSVAFKGLADTSYELYQTTSTLDSSMERNDFEGKQLLLVAQRVFMQESGVIRQTV